MKIGIIVLTAVALMQSALSVAGGEPAGSHAKPSSFVPHAHSNSHVYGAPIQPAIVHRSKTARRTHTHTLTQKKAAPRPKK